MCWYCTFSWRIKIRLLNWQKSKWPSNFTYFYGEVQEWKWKLKWQDHTLYFSRDLLCHNQGGKSPSSFFFFLVYRVRAKGRDTKRERHTPFDLALSQVFTLFILVHLPCRHQSRRFFHRSNKMHSNKSLSSLSLLSKVSNFLFGRINFVNSNF